MEALVVFVFFILFLFHIQKNQVEEGANFLSKAKKTVSKTVSKGGNSVTDPITKVFNAVKDLPKKMDNIPKQMKNLIPNDLKKLPKEITTLKKSIPTKITAFENKITKKATDFYKKETTKAKDLYKKEIDKAKDLYKKELDKAKKEADKVKKEAKSVIKGFQEFFIAIGSYFECALNKIVNLRWCLTWYTTDLVGYFIYFILYVLYFPISMMFWLFESQAMEKVFWETFYDVVNQADEKIEDLTGWSMIHFPDNIIKKCYQCKVKKMPGFK